MLAQAIDPRDVLPVRSAPVTLPGAPPWLGIVLLLGLLAAALVMLFVLLRRDGAYRRWLLVVSLVVAVVIALAASTGSGGRGPTILDVLCILLLVWTVCASLGFAIGWAGGWLGAGAAERCGSCGARMSGEFCSGCGAARPRRAFPLS